MVSIKLPVLRIDVYLKLYPVSLSKQLLEMVYLLKEEQIISQINVFIETTNSLLVFLYRFMILLIMS